MKKLKVIFVLLMTLLVSGINFIQFKIADANDYSYADATPVYIPGMVTSYNARDRINWDMSTHIFKNFEEQMFFTIITRKLAKQRTKTSEFTYFEQIGRNTKMKVVTGFTESTAGTTRDIVVSSNNANGMVKYQTIQFIQANATRTTHTTEALVTNISGTTITLQPNDVSKILATVANDTYFIITGTSYPRGSGKSTAMGTKSVPKKGTTGIFKNSYSLDETLANEDMWGETERANKRMETEFYHREDLERSKLFNEHKILADNTNSVTTRSQYKGILYSCIDDAPSNYTYSGAFDYSLMLAHYYGLFEKRKIQGIHNHRLTLCNQAMTGFYTEENSKKQIIENFDSLKTYGIDSVIRVRIAGGTLDLFEHSMMNERYNDVNKPACFNIHLRYAETRPYRDTFWKANCQEAGQDGTQDEILTEEGFFLSMLEWGMHSVIFPT